MENLMIDSSPDAIDEEGRKAEEYSEWRLLHGGLGWAFDIVAVNEDFHIRDFQSSQGAVSVIDPDTLGRIRKEASVILNNRIRCQLVVVLALFLSCMFTFFYLLGLGLVPPVGMLVNWGVIIFLSYVAYIFLRQNADAKLTALVDSYQNIFLNEYGVELGYRRNNLLFSIYLRRPHQSADKDEAPVVVDSKDMDGRYPPIYLAPLIPGEIHIHEKEYDAASMKVDAETWTLLQSTQQSLIHWHCSDKMTYKAILFLVGWLVCCGWLRTIQYGFIIVAASPYILLFVLKYGFDIRNLKVRYDVTNVVNEALQKDNKQLAVEFHTSVVPGREGVHGQRYQFVQRDLTQTNEMVSLLV